MTTEICLPVNTLAQLEGAMCAGIVTRARRKFAAFRLEGCTVYIPLRAKTPRKPLKAKTPKRADPLLDTRTAPECWLAGDDRKALHRAYKRAAKGEYRGFLVRLADGFTCRTGSYLADDDAAKAEAIRVTRSRAMEARFKADADAELARCRAIAAENAERGEPSAPIRYVDPHPFVWAPTRQLTRACEVAAVESVRVVFEHAGPSTSLSEAYLARMRERGERLRDAVETFRDVPENVTCTITAGFTHRREELPLAA